MKLGELLESVCRARSVLVVGLFLQFTLISRAADEPSTLSELDAWYPAVPVGQNAAMIYADAFASLPENASDPTPAPAVSQKTLALLHRAAKFPNCRYPIDLTSGFQTELPHLAKIKQAAELLKQEALANASKGRADLAVQSVQAGLALARSLEQEPVLISQWVRSRTIDITFSALEQSLWKKAFSDEQLITLQASLKAAETNDTTAYRRAMVGERCSGRAAFKSPLDVFKMVAADLGATNEVTPELEKMVASYIKGGTNKLDEKYYSEQMGSVISAIELPFPDRLDKVQLWRTHLALEDTNGFVISAILLPNRGQTPERSAVGVADLRVAQTVLAIERYRLRNTNSLPKSLKDLVPQYLDAVPTDPFDGQPLRFKVLPQRGYMVYSIGNDRMDDGGIHKPERPAAGSHYDLAMTVLRK